MFATQLKFQKIIAYVSLIIAAIVFVYSLGIMTDIYDMLYSATRELDGEYFSDIEGALLYYEMQPFNKTLLSLSIVLIVINITFFITNGHKRRLYHVGNYVSTGLITVSDIVVAIWGMVQVGVYREKFLQIDFPALKEYADFWDTLYTESTFWFDIGYVVFALLVVAALAIAGNLIWKILLTKQEKALLGSKANEEVAA